MHQIEEDDVGRFIWYCGDLKLPRPICSGERLFELRDDTGHVTRTVCSEIEGCITERYLKCASLVESEDVGREAIILSIGVGCSHNIVLNGLCGMCGEIVAHDNRNSRHKSAVDSHVAVHQKEDVNIMISPEFAEEISMDSLKDAVQSNKLMLILDLDHTLIHAHPYPLDYYYGGTRKATFKEALENCYGDMTEYQIPGSSIDEAIFINGERAYYHCNYDANIECSKCIRILETQVFQIESVFQGCISNTPESYHTYFKIRPGTFKFLRDLSKKYVLIMYTAGAASHAMAALALLDPERKFFDKILTREDLEDNGIKTLRKVLPGGHDIMTVVDDTLEAWESKTAIMLCSPYVYWPSQPHFSRAPGWVFGNPRSRVESFTIGNYLPEVLLAEVGISKDNTPEYNIDTTMPLVYNICRTWSMLEPNAEGIRFPEKLNDSDVQLQCFYHVLQIAHSIFFDVARMGIKNALGDTKITSMERIFEVIASAVLRDHHFLVFESRHKSDGLLRMISYMGATYTSNPEDETITHILITSETELNVMLDREYPTVNVDYIYTAAATFYRPPASAFARGYPRSIFDRITILEDSVSSKDKWPQYSGLTRDELRLSTLVNSVDSTPGISRTNDSPVAPVNSEFSNPLPDKNCDANEAKRQRMNSDRPNLALLKDAVIIDYSRWYTHHEFSFDSYLPRMLDVDSSLPGECFNNAAADLEDSLLEGLI